MYVTTIPTLKHKMQKVETCSKEMHRNELLRILTIFLIGKIRRPGIFNLCV